MAKVRIGFSTQFELENELVGIGTDNATTNLHVLENIHSPNAVAGGGATFTSYDGFVDTKAFIVGGGDAKSGAISDEIIIEGDVTISAGATFTSGPENLTVTDTFTLPGISDDKPTVGTTRFNEDLGSLEFYTGVEWRAVNSRVDRGANQNDRGVFAGGYHPLSTLMTFVNVSTEGNASSFGELTQSMSFGGGVSSGTRGCFGGGRSSPANTKHNVIQYITIASQGNSINFGDLTNARRRIDACSSSTRGLFGPGDGTPTNVNIIDYIEIQTLGDAVDFGDATSASTYSRGALSSSTRGVFFGGGSAYPLVTDIEYVTIASKGNAIRFGHMTEARTNVTGGGSSNGVRGVIAGGYGETPDNALSRVIDQIVIASTGNSVDFGTLGLPTRDFGGCQNMVRALIAGGANPSTYQKFISQISFTTSGHSSDFGDLTVASKSLCGLSGSHGGLGGF